MVITDGKNDSIIPSYSSTEVSTNINQDCLVSNIVFINNIKTTICFRDPKQ